MQYIDLLDLLIYLVVPPILVIVGYFSGTYVERRHYASVRAREAQYRGFPVLNFPTPSDWQVAAAGLVSGSVVISVDYFKRFAALLRNLIGGRLRSYEPLLDRARREAVLRMIEQALAEGYDAVVNVRLETSTVASGGAGQGRAGVEMLAFGTALKLARE